MKVYSDINGSDFKFWSGAIDTVNYLTDKEINDICDTYLNEDVYPDGISETQLNDFFWFETDPIAEFLGYEDFDELMEDRKDW